MPKPELLILKQQQQQQHILIPRLGFSVAKQTSEIAVNVGYKAHLV